MIYITGDTHGDFSRFEKERFSNLTKEDYIIICGDFGGIWHDKKIPRQEKKNLKDLSKMKFTTLFIDGNHENFNRLYKYPIVNWHGGKVHKITNSVFHLIRGEIYELDGKRIFVFGGAESHDIKNGIVNVGEVYKIEELKKKHATYRIRNVNWWDLEMPQREEYENGLINLKKYNYKVDYIITHCAPTSIQNYFNPYYPINELTNYFEKIKEKVEFKQWYFGHYHKNNIDKFDKYKCLYEMIIELN